MKLSLYHSTIATCSQKVRLALAEKALPWTSYEIDLVAGEQKQPDYLALNPNGVVPTLLADGRVVLESSVINEFIEDISPGRPLLPAQAIERAECRTLIKLIDDKIHPAVGTIHLATTMRRMQSMRPADEVLEEIAAAYPRSQQDMRIALFTEGMEAAAAVEAISTLVNFLDAIEGRLSDQPWLSGDRFTLADCAAAPYVLRLELLGQTQLWDGGARPNIRRWLTALKGRASYFEGIERWQSEIVVQLLRSIGPELTPAFEPT